MQTIAADAPRMISKSLTVASLMLRRRLSAINSYPRVLFPVHAQTRRGGLRRILRGCRRYRSGARRRAANLIANVSSSKPQRFCNGLAGAQLAAQDPVYATTIDLIALRKSGLPALAFNSVSS